MLNRLAMIILVLALFVGCNFNSQGLPQSPDDTGQVTPLVEQEQPLPNESPNQDNTVDTVEETVLEAPVEVEKPVEPKEKSPLIEVVPDTSLPEPKTMLDVKDITDKMAELYYENPAELEKIDNESVVWGPGVAKDGQVPPDPIKLQAKYGEYGAMFYAENSKQIYLSFDEGYELGYTPQILDILKEKDVKAVFFVTMGYVKSRPDLVQRMVDEGHVLGNHSTAHPVGGMPTMDIYQIAKDIAKLHIYVEENFGYKMTLFRPPEGTFSQRSLMALKELNYTSVLWSFAYNDWNPENQKPLDEALEHMTSCLHPGGVYLLHAVSSTNTGVLGRFIDDTIENGYSFSDWSDITG